LKEEKKRQRTIIYSFKQLTRRKKKVRKHANTYILLDRDIRVNKKTSTKVEI